MEVTEEAGDDRKRRRVVFEIVDKRRLDEDGNGFDVSIFTFINERNMNEDSRRNQLNIYIYISYSIALNKVHF